MGGESNPSEVASRRDYFLATRREGTSKIAIFRPGRVGQNWTLELLLDWNFQLQLCFKTQKKTPPVPVGLAVH